MEVGIRELRLKLSEYIRLARSGENVVVTNRGRPVAQLTAPSRARVALAEGAGEYRDGRADTGNRVGVRELKARLPEFLRRAEGGETVLVADRDQVVAELRHPPLDLAEVVYPEGVTEQEIQRMREALVEYPPPPSLWPLLRQGMLHWKGPPRYLPNPVKMLPGDPEKDSTYYVRLIRGKED